MATECEKLDIELRANALDVVEGVWMGIDWKTISTRRRMRIYDEYTAKIRSAAHTGRFTSFYGGLCRKMESSPRGEWAQQTRAAIQNIEKRGFDIDILELIINEYQYIVLLLRERNDARKAARESEPIKQTSNGGS